MRAQSLPGLIERGHEALAAQDRPTAALASRQSQANHPPKFQRDPSDWTIIEPEDKRFAGVDGDLPKGEIRETVIHRRVHCRDSKAVCQNR